MSASQQSVTAIISSLFEGYAKETPRKVKLVDCFLMFYVLCGIVILAYCCLITAFPFNSFLAAFISCVGSFVLIVSLRMHLMGSVPGVSSERAFADFLLCAVVLHLFVFNFMG